RRVGGRKRLRWCGRARLCQDATRGEIRCLVNHPGLRILHMRVEISSVRTNEVIGDAQIDGFGRIRRPDFDLWLTDRSHKPGVWFSEWGDRGDVAGHVGRHRVRYTLRSSIGYDIRGDEAHHRCTLRESAEHH